MIRTVSPYGALPREPYIVFSEKFAANIHSDAREYWGRKIMKIASSCYYEVSGVEGNIKKIQNIQRFRIPLIQPIVQFVRSVLYELAMKVVEKSDSHHRRYAELLKKKTVILDAVHAGEQQTGEITAIIQSGWGHAGMERSPPALIKISLSTTAKDILDKMDEKSPDEVNSINVEFSEKGQLFSISYNANEKGTEIIAKVNELREKGETPSVVLCKYYKYRSGLQLGNTAPS
jgi:hypothetical protein